MSERAETPVAVSVIVPVYNVEAFLAPCLDSLANLAFDRPLEVLLVDDASTDGSKAICQRYVARHPHRFTLLPLAAHEGISIARNTGLRAASGEFFAYVDGDDLVPPNAFHDLYQAAVAHHADIVKGNNTIFDQSRSRIAPYNTRALRIYHGDDILSVFYEHKKTRGHTWGKLFRRSSLAGIQCTPGVLLAQDALYCAELFHRAQTLVLLNQTVYHYRLRQGRPHGWKFESQAYLWWLYSVEQSGRFARTPRHVIGHKQLQIRTLLQLAREARALPPDKLPPVLREIAARQQSWNLASLRSVWSHGVGAHSLLHFLAYRRTLRRLQKKLRLAPPPATP